VSIMHPAGVQKSIRKYWVIFGVLTLGTVVTVALANLQLGVMLGIAVALIVAAVKGSLVAGYFMHLFGERKLVYAVVGLTAFLFVALLIISMVAYGDQQGSKEGAFRVPARHAQPHHGDGEAVHVP
jgi:caa(3)-type oxidase subunit IV